MRRKRSIQINRKKCLPHSPGDIYLHSAIPSHNKKKKNGSSLEINIRFGALIVLLFCGIDYVYTHNSSNSIRNKCRMKTEKEKRNKKK